MLPVLSLSLHVEGGNSVTCYQCVNGTWSVLFIARWTWSHQHPTCPSNHNQPSVPVEVLPLSLIHLCEHLLRAVLNSPFSIAVLPVWICVGLSYCWCMLFNPCPSRPCLPHTPAAIHLSLSLFNCSSSDQKYHTDY